MPKAIFVAYLESLNVGFLFEGRYKKQTKKCYKCKNDSQRYKPPLLKVSEAKQEHYAEKSGRQDCQQ